MCLRAVLRLHHAHAATFIDAEQSMMVHTTVVHKGIIWLYLHFHLLLNPDRDPLQPSPFQTLENDLRRELMQVHLVTTDSNGDDGLIVLKQRMLHHAQSLSERQWKRDPKKCSLENQVLEFVRILNQHGDKDLTNHWLFPAALQSAKDLVFQVIRWKVSETRARADKSEEGSASEELHRLHQTYQNLAAMNRPSRVKTFSASTIEKLSELMKSDPHWLTATEILTSEKMAILKREAADYDRFVKIIKANAEGASLFLPEIPTFLAVSEVFHRVEPPGAPDTGSSKIVAAGEAIAPGRDAIERSRSGEHWLSIIRRERLPELWSVARP
ncbi:hypothetical protein CAUPRSCDRAFT_11924 [Caulochytrium protostelioides]|uniref:Uncharacterized protein n=1 Tax=Caulochytrium protostelioides TaxID=1555241 RepID=A0A4V1ITA6_9FUNG|nr:hypothetical protein CAUPRSCDRAFT_11924 [Caulochytrium protostelioides]